MSWLVGWRGGKGMAVAMLVDVLRYLVFFYPLCQCNFPFFFANLGLQDVDAIFLRPML